jgi:hypothetical protein
VGGLQLPGLDHAEAPAWLRAERFDEVSGLRHSVHRPEGRRALPRPTPRDQNRRVGPATSPPWSRRASYDTVWRRLRGEAEGPTGDTCVLASWIA